MDQGHLPCLKQGPGGHPTVRSRRRAAGGGSLHSRGGEDFTGSEGADSGWRSSVTREPVAAAPLTRSAMRTISSRDLGQVGGRSVLWTVCQRSCCCRCQVASAVSDSVWPHRRQPTRLLRPWDSPGRSTGGAGVPPPARCQRSRLWLQGVRERLFWMARSYSPRVQSSTVYNRQEMEAT